MRWSFVIAPIAIALGLYCLHRLALWAESRGWIYYRTKRMPPGAAGMAMMHISEVFEPEFEHVLDEMYSEIIRAEDSESDDGRFPEPDQVS